MKSKRVTLNENNQEHVGINFLNRDNSFLKSYTLPNRNQKTKEKEPICSKTYKNDENINFSNIINLQNSNFQNNFTAENNPFIRLNPFLKTQEENRAFLLDVSEKEKLSISPEFGLIKNYTPVKFNPQENNGEKSISTRENISNNNTNISNRTNETGIHLKNNVFISEINKNFLDKVKYLSSTNKNFELINVLNNKSFEHEQEINKIICKNFDSLKKNLKSSKITNKKTFCVNSPDPKIKKTNDYISFLGKSSLKDYNYNSSDELNTKTSKINISNESDSYSDTQSEHLNQIYSYDSTDVIPDSDLIFKFLKYNKKENIEIDDNTKIIREFTKLKEFENDLSDISKHGLCMKESDPESDSKVTHQLLPSKYRDDEKYKKKLVKFLQLPNVPNVKTDKFKFNVKRKFSEINNGNLTKFYENLGTDFRKCCSVKKNFEGLHSLEYDEGKTQIFKIFKDSEIGITKSWQRQLKISVRIYFFIFNFYFFRTNLFLNF